MKHDIQDCEYFTLITTNAILIYFTTQTGLCPIIFAIFIYLTTQTGLYPIIFQRIMLINDVQSCAHRSLNILA